MATKSPRDPDAPIWARYKAQDDDGTWHWFECNPNYYRKVGKWAAASGNCEVAEVSKRDDPAMCEACGEPATHFDSALNDLCARCWAALPVIKDRQPVLDESGSNVVLLFPDSQGGAGK